MAQPLFSDDKICSSLFEFGLYSKLEMQLLKSTCVVIFSNNSFFTHCNYTKNSHVTSVRIRHIAYRPLEHIKILTLFQKIYVKLLLIIMFLATILRSNFRSNIRRENIFSKIPSEYLVIGSKLSFQCKKSGSGEKIQKIVPTYNIYILIAYLKIRCNLF